jgi:hypothetical protein
LRRRRPEDMEWSLIGENLANLDLMSKLYRLRSKYQQRSTHLRTYKSWIQQCYLHRMKEILTNPAEFGKVVLEEKKRMRGKEVYSKLRFGGLLVDANLFPDPSF